LGAVWGWVKKGWTIKEHEELSGVIDMLVVFHDLNKHVKKEENYQVHK
jgi:nitrate reductase NapAB chaperone NapD